MAGPFDRIENATSAELREQREAMLAELVELAPPLPDLAARYMQARLDAKRRDDKMSVQGTTITQLEQKILTLETSLAHVLQLQAQLRGQVDALRVEAQRHQEVFTTVHKILADALFAEQVGRIGEGSG